MPRALYQELQYLNVENEILLNYSQRLFMKLMNVYDAVGSSNYKANFKPCQYVG